MQSSLIDTLEQTAETTTDPEVWLRKLTAELAEAYRALEAHSAERERLEEALCEAEAKRQLLFESNPNPMWVYDPVTLSFLAVNDAATRQYGYSPEEFLALTMPDICSTEEASALPEKVSRADTVSDLAGIRRHRRKDGTLIEVEITAHPLTYAGRRAELVLVNDISERKSLEEQLRQAQKMEAIGRLAGGVAHDFNNLLTAIKGYSELLLDRLSPDDPLRSQIEEIKKAGDRAASLTRQLLVFSRKQPLQPKVLSLNAIVSDLHAMLKRLIGEDIELKMVLEPTLGAIKADPGQIEQVIMNLAINARDAMPQGGKLTIETGNVELDENYARQHIGVRPGSYVMLAVSDTGCGMDEETLSHIFEPFFTTKDEGEGTGLGLSTVYGIVKHSGGDIWVQSEPGQGTTFKIHLPRTEEAVEDAPAKLDCSQRSKGRETILLVEDEEMVRALACEILQTSGYRVLEARHGGEAIQLSTHYPGRIHLMVTDVVMPQMSGVELAKHLAPLRPEMKVLYMSGYTDRTVAHYGLAELGPIFLQKPFTLDTLTCKVRQALDAC